MTAICICGTKKNIKQCCGRFLEQLNHAKTPVQLMRSRYSAYALGGYGDYLLATWHADYRHSLSAADLSIRSTDWLRLEVMDKSQKGDQGMVEFKAYYLDDTGQQASHHERSTFQRLGGKWFYVSGDVF